MFIQINQLNKHQLTELDDLVAECKKKDGNTIPIYKHLLSQQRNKPCNVLFYHQQHLVGFISAFFFYETACEIVLMIAPAFRKQGIALKLLAKLLPLFRTYFINTLIFPVAHGLNEPWISNYNFHYQHSEYEMQRLGRQGIPHQQNVLQMRLATSSDLEFICTIDKACFPQQTDTTMHLQALLADKNYSIILALLNDVIIGKAHLHWLEDNVRLTDIAITPIHQGRGFGRSLISYCINYAIRQGKSAIILDVETKNKKALSLYTNLGFKITNACDYWLIPINAFSGQFT
ncbi:GNAT family N-acetyltransferase [Legionella oakridgensis]|uniref:Acetyltransferase n=2 Tax=Legionella oakridgensis TaxID=29423 RepID=W0B778_9GAMM|nr:GNAT family N-acetyltransferase [Legionella oakridgensis]AHE65720.1 acetyltransferase [Legionella oakridgensis ATCC 33761 = DSM 21215]KTD38204.1 hypothetical protein Loak_1880 [Legionella oakridgensis]STY15666.1 N-terminal acetyltransferase, GNAT family [Legionella longbeachae]